MAIKKIITFTQIFLILLNPSFLNAQTLLIPGIMVSPIQFEAYIQVHSHYETFSSHYLNTLSEDKQIQILMDTFEEAQRYRFENKIELAIEKYKNVIAQRHSLDWPSNQQIALCLSYLYLSKLDPVQQRNWILSLIEFNSEFNSIGLSVPDKEFSLYKKQSADHVKKHLKFKKIKTFDQILINGKLFQTSHIPLLPEGTKRVTLLSNFYHPITLVGTLSEISNALEKIKPRPFLKDDCYSPLQNQDPYPNGTQLFWSESCIKSFGALGWKNIFEPETKLTSSSLFEQELKQETPLAVSENKKKWIAFGIVFLMGGALYYNYQSSPTKVKIRHD